MPNLRTYTTDAVILRTSPIGEADRLLTLLTPRLGKISATARGVRKITSKLSGHLDILTRSTLTLNKGLTLDTITSAEAIETFIILKNNLTAVSHAIYMTELADAFNPLDSPSEASYSLLLSGLRALEGENDPEMVLRFLELRSLQISGFSPELLHCVECSELILAAHHFFSPSSGGVLCSSCKPTLPYLIPLSVDALKVLRYFSTNSLAASLKIQAKPSLKKELATLLGSTLRYVLERELRSSTFVRLMDHKNTQANELAVAKTSS